MCNPPSAPFSLPRSHCKVLWMKEASQGRSRGKRAHREQKWVRVVSQFLEQALLEVGRGTHGPNGRVYLDPRKVQVPAEGQANHINVLLAIAEGASQSDIHWEEDAHR